METIRPTKIGIFGSDTTHTPAFYKILKQRDDVEVVWIATEAFGDLEISQSRYPIIIEELKKLDAPLSRDVDLEAVDAFFVLNCDAHYHWEIVSRILRYQKPIYIDKPISYGLSELKRYQSHPQVPIMSLSALACSYFVRKAQKVQHDTKIKIEAPLSFVDGIPSYYWYGIHAIEMMIALDPTAQIQTINFHSQSETAYAKGEGYEFELEWIKVGDPEFCIKTTKEKYSIYDNEHPLYSYLLDEILAFVEHKKGNLDHCQKIIEQLERCSQLKEEFDEKDTSNWK